MNYLKNIAEVFSVDLLYLQPNTRLLKLMVRKTFEELGSPAWYIDALIYAFPYRLAAQLGINLLVYGENINYTYGGKHNYETPSARMGHVTREEMIPLVKTHDKKLDQRMVDGYLQYTGTTPREFWQIMDKWYNRDLFYQDRDGVWHEKFEVGVGMVEGIRGLF